MQGQVEQVEGVGILGVVVCPPTAVEREEDKCVVTGCFHPYGVNGFFCEACWGEVPEDVRESLEVYGPRYHKRPAVYRRSFFAALQRGQDYVERLVEMREAAERRTGWMSVPRLKWVVAWWDFWVGVYVDRERQRVYVLPVPMLGVCVDFGRK